MTLAGCSRSGMEEQSEYVMGTLCRLNLFEYGTPALYRRLFGRLAELEMILSANRDDSELAKVNKNAGLEPVAVSPELYTVLDRALYFAKATEGAFDPTVGPLVKLWGIGAENPRIPSDEEISSALDLVNYGDLELSAANGDGIAPAAGRAFLKRQGMVLDLGAIAKGYAADELVRILQEEKVPRAIIDLGGNIYVWGKKPKGPWYIGVQDPLSARGAYAGILELPDSNSVVSSGVYERFFMGPDGRRYHHILELKEGRQGKRGYPAGGGLLSTTIIALSSMDADALSTSCFVLDYEKGLALAAENGAEVIYIEEKVINNAIGIAIKGSPGAMAVFSEGH